MNIFISMEKGNGAVFLNKTILNTNQLNLTDDKVVISDHGLYIVGIYSLMRIPVHDQLP